MNCILWFAIGLISGLLVKGIINYVFDIHDKHLESRGDIED